MTWEPFESIPVMDGYGYFARNLEYRTSKAVGAELGLLVASKTAADAKKAAVERFVWVYLKTQEELAASPPKFADAYARLSGMALNIAAGGGKGLSSSVKSFHRTRSSARPRRLPTSA